MKVQIKAEQFGIDETLEGETAEAIVEQAKLLAAKQVPWFLRRKVRKMGEVRFANEVIKRFERAKEILPRTEPVTTCEQFIDWAVLRKLAVIIPEEVSSE